MTAAVKSGPDSETNDQGVRRHMLVDGGRAYGVDPDCIWHAERVIWLGGVEDECMKNSGDVMTSIMGSRGTGRRSISPADYRGGEGIKREKEELGQLPRV